MHSRARITALSATAACLALALTACGSGGSDNAGVEGETGTEDVTLSVGTFNEFGYEELFTEYEELNPNVTIEHKKAATSNEARDNLTTRLAMAPACRTSRASRSTGCPSCSSTPTSSPTSATPPWRAAGSTGRPLPPPPRTVS